jgi:hypothetical protein
MGIVAQPSIFLDAATSWMNLIGLLAAVFALGLVNLHSSSHALFYETLDKNPFLYLACLNGLIIAVGTSLFPLDHGVAWIFVGQVLSTFSLLAFPSFYLGRTGLRLDWLTYFSAVGRLSARRVGRIVILGRRAPIVPTGEVMEPMKCSFGNE